MHFTVPTSNEYYGLIKKEVLSKKRNFSQAQLEKFAQDLKEEIKFYY